ncbi:MAG: carboxypeptidase regulatory-like domain-containing protein [Acidimicrobiia bacterium]|nr:carboxypeptidase regulatory-like domain-containing protein [Acidimicrobiia bacterium]
MAYRRWHLGLAVAALSAVLFPALQARQAPQVPVDPDDIGGVVQGPTGPEAGVWVIAETDDLPTKLRKIVVTDDRGRFLVPDLPRATYRLWVRGYGLVDSQPVSSAPGRTLQLTAVPAPTPQAAARIYPPNYWHSLLELPGPSEFPGTGANGNGIPTTFKSQAEWIAAIQVGCNNCHAMGDPITRTLAHLKGYKTSVDAWRARARFGQRGDTSMTAGFNVLGPRAIELYADWTDRIAAGEVPAQPPRPTGIERNLVLTLWDWGAPTSYIHDLISTDKRKPTLNPNGLIYGVDFGRDYLTVLDPVESKATEYKVPVRENANNRSNFPLEVKVPSPFFGEEIIWNAPAHPHNPMMDGKGRIWITSQIRDSDDQPAFCREGSTHPSAQFYPLEQGGGHQVSMFDPKTEQFTLIDTCFGTHHLQFDEDPDDTLYLSGVGNTVGWINTRVFDETGDAEKAQGWCPIVIDTNGDGKAGPWIDEPPPGGMQGTHSFKGDNLLKVDPTKDVRLLTGGYGIIVNPVDHSVWIANPGPFPGRVARLDPKTCLSEVYEPPMKNPNAPKMHGATPRGVDVDRNGLIWTALAGTGQTASFDRRRCRVTNGPTATGQHCPEGWTLYETPGPRFKNQAEPGTSQYHYYNWVDQFNTLGLGHDVPVSNGSASDSLFALQRDSGKMVQLRVPYPVGFFTRGLDGRIDDPDAGWKGRGLWANQATNTVWHQEGGKGSHPYVAHFQMRPDPLAK